MNVTSSKVEIDQLELFQFVERDGGKSFPFYQMPACQKKCQLLNLEEETEKESKISQSKSQSVNLKNSGTEIITNYCKNLKLKILNQ